MAAFWDAHQSVLVSSSIGHLFLGYDSEMTEKFLLNTLESKLNSLEKHYSYTWMQLRESKVVSSKALNASLVVTECSGTKSDEHITRISLGTYITHVVDADIRPVNDRVPSVEVHLTAQHNVLANEQQYTDQSEPSYDTYLLEKDTWRGDVAFKSLYRRVYALESCKSVTIASKLSYENVGYSLRRVPRGGAEQVQFLESLANVKGISLAAMRDMWAWSLKGSGEFSVASVRKLIDDRMLPEVSPKTRWIIVVPIKVNVHVWKVRLDCLPTMLNISRRGMNIEFILFPICGKEVKSSSHILFVCQIVREVFRKITYWWDANLMEVSSYEEWLDWILKLRLHYKYKQLLERVSNIMWWLSWSFRNKSIFGSDLLSKAMLFDDAVARAFYWPSQPIPKTLNHQTSPRFNSRTHHSAMTNSNTPPPPPALTLVEKLYAVHNINSLVPEKLDLQESNYSTWSYFFKGHCSNFNVLNHIDGSTSTSDPPTDEWITADSIVKSWIFLTLSPTLRKRMISTNPASAKAAWDTIETIFQENKRTRTVALKGELRVIQMGDDTPDAYFSKIDSIITLLTDLGSTMDDDDIVTYAINGLSEKYGSLAQIIAHKDPFPDLATVRTMVTTEEMRLRSKQPILSTSTTSSSPQVLLATSQPRIQDNRNNRDRDARNENKTEICRNFGRGYCRWGTNCRFIHASPKGTNNPRPNSSQHNTRSMQQGPGHTGLNSASQQHLLSLIQAQQNLLAQYGLSISQGQQPVQHNNTMGLRPNAPPGFQQTQPHQPTFGFNGHQQALYSAAVQNQSASSGSTSQETQLPHAFNTLTLQDPANSNWNMDTGASSHLNSSVNNLSTIFNSRIYPSVLVGDGKSIPVTNTGHSTLPTPYRTLHLNNVLITPNIVKNLISVRQFVRENKCTIEFDEFGFSVKDFWTRQILLRCDSTGDLYPVTSPSYPQAFLVGQQTWHQRLGHPGSEVLRSLVSNNLISCNKTQSSVLCHACQLGKHVRLPFSLSETIVKAPFDIIHSDLWTSPLTSVSGIKYYVLFLDHFSHYLWVYPLRHKSDVLSKFIHFRAYVKNHFNCDIKSLQCDHGGEFDNTALHQLFVTNGISIRFSCPKTSQQNGKSERMIRTINNMIRTLLFQAHLPPTFWVEALHMAAYLLNILPSTAINNEIPHTRLFKTTPNYADLRVFGCLCYPHLHTNHKLEPRATPAIFLGYPTNHRGYRCLDLNTNKIILSRHVTFDETVFPYGSMTPHDSPSYTFLDTSPNIIHQHIISKLTSASPLPTTTITSTAAPPSPPRSPLQPAHQTHESSPLPHSPNVQPTSNASTKTTIPTHNHNNPTLTHPMVTRFCVGTNRPTQRFNLHVSTISPIPKSYPIAFRDPNWYRAMLDEYTILIKNNTWILVPQPSDANIFHSMWLFWHKYNAHGTLSQYKAHLVQMVALRSLSETVYMHQPTGFQDPFVTYAARVGFHHSRYDSSLFIYRQGADTAYLLLYVDDIGLTASSSDLLQQIITFLHAEFSMTDFGSLNYFLGIFVTRNASGMFLSLQKYATEVLDWAGMLNYKPCRTPVDTDSKLSADGAPISDSTLYRSLAGALQYLTFTRPDISYAVQQVCLFMHDPREPHLSALKRILRYVRGTLSYGLQLYSSTTSSLVAYSDADWAGCPTTRRSTSGYCVFLGNNLLSWSSKRQFTLSRSSAEAEYRGVANAVAETCWLRNLLRELHTPLATATLVYCDNVSAVYLSSNPVQHQRTKHIEIDIHFVRDLVATGAIRVLHVPSRYQYADIFTKGLPTSLFDEFRTSLSVRSSPGSQTAGAVNCYKTYWPSLKYVLKHELLELVSIACVPDVPNNFTCHEVGVISDAAPMNVGEVEDFKVGNGFQARAVFVNANGRGFADMECLGDIENSFSRMGILSKLLPIISSLVLQNATWRSLMTLNRSLRYNTCDLILANVFVFSPKPSMHLLNITMRNVVKVFHKDSVPGNDSGVGGSGMLMEEEEIVKLMEKEMADLELQVCRNVTDQEMLLKKHLTMALEEKSKAKRDDQEWVGDL
ncbi:ribonuclease H-like domain-containing protein [Tanacetum coccineum]